MFPPQDHFFECIITFGILLADLSTNCQSLPHFSAKRVDFTLNAQVTANPISAKVEFARVSRHCRTTLSHLSSTPPPSFPRKREPIGPQLPSPKSEKPGTTNWMPAFAGMTGMGQAPDTCLAQNNRRPASLSSLPRSLPRLAPFTVSRPSTVASLLYRHSRERGSPSHGKHPHPANCHPPPNRL